MHSKQYIKQLIIANDVHNKVLFEGCLGDLQTLSLIDEEMLEITGTYGILRLDIHATDLRKLIQSNKEIKIS